MKRIFTAIFSCMAVWVSGQQVSDIVTTGPQYENQIWYSMANGEVGSAELNNWDLAFEISGFTSSIRFNEQKGMELYAAPYTIAEWGEMDTTGMAGWSQLHNDPKNWQRGAFNGHLASEFDLGWGIYNMVTHVVAGDSIYILKLQDGNIKKLRIDALASGTYTFTHANIDGSSEVTGSLAKADFSGKNFGYYRFEANEVVDREPLSEEWDLTFTKYVELIGPNFDMPYGVAGVLHNYNVRTGQASATPVNEAEPWNFSFLDDINTIGYDWKTFDFSLGYIIEADNSYFVEAQDGMVYHIVFTDFEGSPTGVYEFTVEESGVLTAGTSESGVLHVFPNPSSGQNITLSWKGGNANTLRILDAEGRVVRTTQLEMTTEKHEIPVNHLSPGMYILQLSGTNTAITEKIIITD